MEIARRIREGVALLLDDHSPSYPPLYLEKKRTQFYVLQKGINTRKDITNNNKRATSRTGRNKRMGDRSRRKDR